MWTKETVWARMLANEPSVLKALLLIDARQTADERAERQTVWHNGQGWNRFDAQDLGRYAARVRNGRQLDRREFFEVRARLKKYTGQVAEILNARRVPTAA